MRININLKYKKVYKIQTPFEKFTAGWNLETMVLGTIWYSDPSDPRRGMQVQYFIDKNTGDEKLQTVTYFKGGDLHKDDGPARIQFLDDRITRELWYVNGKQHREDGPAEISYYPNGRVRSEEYYVNNSRHREDGPAEIIYNTDGTIGYEGYYTHGKRTNSKEY